MPRYLNTEIWTCKKVHTSQFVSSNGFYPRILHGKETPTYGQHIQKINLMFMITHPFQSSTLVLETQFHIFLISSYLLLKSSPSDSSSRAIFWSSLCITISSFCMLSESSWSSKCVAAMVCKYSNTWDPINSTCSILFSVLTSFAPHSWPRKLYCLLNAYDIMWSIELWIEKFCSIDLEVTPDT